MNQLRVVLLLVLAAVCVEALSRRNATRHHHALTVGEHSDNEHTGGDDIPVVDTEAPVHHVHHHKRNHTRHHYPTDANRPELEYSDSEATDATECGECVGLGSECVQGKCVCRAGFGGPECSVFLGCFDNNFCSGHGQCQCSSGGCVCVCRHGWLGGDCATPLGSHCPNHCSGKGECRLSNFTCVCLPGFTGEDCSVASVTACPDACSGRGHCNTTTGQCECVGSSGPNCAHILKGCAGGCRHGVCVFSENFDSSTCVCDRGFSGAACDLYSPLLDPCSAPRTAFCSGRGVCLAQRASRYCDCLDGFATLTCGLFVLPEANATTGCLGYCSAHGKCNAITNECECFNGWQGKDCNTPTCPMYQAKMCGGHGVCEPVVGASYSQCKCDTCFSGDDCSVNEVERCPALCNSRGSCVCDPQVQNGNSTGKGVCQCNAGWTGAECETSTVKETGDNCCPLGCGGNGECNNCVCTCFDGWTGEDCVQSTAKSVELPPAAQEGFDVIANLLQTAEGGDDGLAVVDEQKATHSMSRLWD
eukprot:c8183_g1_i1.p1 GENE.c8183_g1_i1~~c8183_g1_i1.p1  ORF type:complete len:567 (+),score=148.30 c8183_g1_i1:107-1702(+)